MSDKKIQSIEEAEKEISRLQNAIRHRDEFIRKTFGRYLTDEVVEEILDSKDGLKIGGERREVSILFTDLRHSTEISEQMNPEDFIRMLNHYLSEMIEIINAWQGNILEFVGDAIVVVFGAPKVNDESARDAVACAVAMQRRMEAVNAWNREHGFRELAQGIGIHKGAAILGNIGSQTRMKYDMIGRNVNLTSRIEGYTEGGQILVSDEALEAAGSLVHTDPDGDLKVKPKGIKEEITIHSVIGFGKSRIPGHETDNSER